MRPLCFVLMPFGRKDDPARPGCKIDFDALYSKAIGPAIEDAELDPIRADEKKTGGVIHKAMFERLLLCDFAIAELTTPNANVFYELGVRHAARHSTTLPIFAGHTTMPFDVALLRALRYELGPNDEVGDAEARGLREDLATRLRNLREIARTATADDSPIFQMVGKAQQSNLPLDARLRRVREADSALYELLNRYALHDKTDVFRGLVQYNEKGKQRLAGARVLARKSAVPELDAIRKELEPLEDVEAGLIVDLYLSYREVSAWNEMISLYEDMPASLKRSVLVREQCAFALNRRAEALVAEAEKRSDPPPAEARKLRDQALAVLDGVLAEIGASSETYGLMGRIHKGQWDEAVRSKRADEARGHLKKAIKSYVAGFEADWRDAYPGVNGVTLLDVEGSEESLRKRDELLPVVRFAVDRRIAGKPDYWDHATLLELEVLASRVEGAHQFCDDAIVSARADWELATTAKNLGYLRDARASRGVDASWLEEIIGDLIRGAEEMKGG